MLWPDRPLWDAVVGPNLGLDWAAIVVSIAAFHIRCRASQTVRWLSMVVNVIWFAVGLRNGSPAIAAGNLGFLESGTA